MLAGLPHSEIHGSKLVRSSPWLIAAYHVFHRLSAPRHPPNTLMALDRSHFRYPPPTFSGLREIASFLRPIQLFHSTNRASIASRRKPNRPRKTSSCELHPTVPCGSGLNPLGFGDLAHPTHRPNLSGQSAGALGCHFSSRCQATYGPKG